MRRISLDEFVKKAKRVHGEKYNYDKSVYIDYDTKLEIICKEHGSFWQTPGNHLKGKGCPYCNGNAKLTTKEFIKKAIEKWGDKFDYSLVEYKNSITKVCIIDRKNGCKFWQTPANHLFGYNCSKGGILNTDNFIIKAKEIHGNLYDYSNAEYKKIHEKVCIVCPEHGEFWQTPANHLNGEGCPKCKSVSVLEKRLRIILQELNVDFTEQQRFDFLGKLSLDFYLPNYKIAIECQGKQHFIASKFWEDLETIAERDKNKKELCANNGITIIYVINKNYSSRNNEIYNESNTFNIKIIKDYLVKLIKENEK